MEAPETPACCVWQQEGELAFLPASHADQGGFLVQSFANPEVPHLDTGPAEAPLTPPEAFAALAEVVQQLLERGRSTRGASIKQMLQMQTGFRFQEKALGFETFRAFLLAAQDAGVVTLHPAVSGPDVDVLLAAEGGTPSTAEGLNGDEKIQRIRPDLWDIFVNHSPGWIRLFDLRTGLALRLPKDPAPQEPFEQQAWRRAYQADPDRFRPVEPIGMSTTLQWMGDFVAGLQDGPVRDELRTALAQPLPLREFTRAVRSREIGAAWNQLRLANVRDHIVRWAAEHGLNVDVFNAPEPPKELMPAPLPKPDDRERAETGGRPKAEQTARGWHGRTSSRDPLVPPIDADALRRWAHDVVDRMTLSELLRLPLDVDTLYRR
jgi:Uncharacterised protein family (UPF0158)